jgi:hypothetical protein
MMFPTISRRSLLTGMMKSRRTLYIQKKNQSINQCAMPTISAFCLTVYLYSHTVAQIRWNSWLKRGGSRTIPHA